SFAESFVVEADVAAGNRRIQFLAGFGDAVNHLRKLPHDIRLFGIAEVEAVGGADRSRSRAGHFARGFGDRVHGAETGIEIAPAAIAIERHGEPAFRALDADDASIARSGSVDRIGQHHVVILLPYPTLRANVGTREQALQIWSEVASPVSRFVRAAFRKWFWEGHGFSRAADSFKSDGLYPLRVTKGRELNVLR